MSHLETLKAHLKAQKLSLKNAEATVERYKQLSVTRHTKINDKAQRQLVGEYEGIIIPKTKRLIASLEYAIELVENRT